MRSLRVGDAVRAYGPASSPSLGLPRDSPDIVAQAARNPASMLSLAHVLVLLQIQRQRFHLQVVDAALTGAAQIAECRLGDSRSRFAGCLRPANLLRLSREPRRHARIPEPRLTPPLCSALRYAHYLSRNPTKATSRQDSLCCLRRSARVARKPWEENGKKTE